MCRELLTEESGDGLAFDGETLYENCVKMRRVSRGGLTKSLQGQQKRKRRNCKQIFKTSLDLLFSHEPAPTPPLHESSADPLRLKIVPEDLCSPHTAQEVLQQLLGKRLETGSWGHLQAMFEAEAGWLRRNGHQATMQRQTTSTLSFLPQS